MYTPLIHLQATTESDRVLHGNRGSCRFCGTSDQLLFKQETHLVPEAMGNKRIYSVDECDTCNQKFSLYEDALAAATGPLLTLGGTKGKGGKVRQSGRSAGDSVLTHDRVEGKRQLRLIVRNDEDYRDRVTQENEWVVIRIALPKIPFKPLFAYKALIKMALALVPVEDLVYYSHLRQMLLDRNELAFQGTATVGLSFGSIGNAPPTVVACLLKRVDDSLPIPKFIFIVCAGSVCLQIFLTADSYPHDEIRSGTPSLKFNVVFGQPAAEHFRIEYGHPRRVDWSAVDPQSQPLSEMELRFNMITTQGEFHPIWR